MVAKLGNREDPLPQDSFEGVDEDEWVSVQVFCHAPPRPVHCPLGPTRMIPLPRISCALACSHAAPPGALVPPPSHTAHCPHPAFWGNLLHLARCLLACGVEWGVQSPDRLWDPCVPFCDLGWPWPGLTQPRNLLGIFYLFFNLPPSPIVPAALVPVDLGAGPHHQAF